MCGSAAKTSAAYLRMAVRPDEMCRRSTPDIDQTRISSRRWIVMPIRRARVFIVSGRTTRAARPCSLLLATGPHAPDPLVAELPEVTPEALDVGTVRRHAAAGHVDLRTALAAVDEPSAECRVRLHLLHPAGLVEPPAVVQLIDQFGAFGGEAVDDLHRLAEQPRRADVADRAVLLDAVESHHRAHLDQGAEVTRGDPHGRDRRVHQVLGPEDVSVHHVRGVQDLGRVLRAVAVRADVVERHLFERRVGALLDAEKLTLDAVPVTDTPLRVLVPEEVRRRIDRERLPLDGDAVEPAPPRGERLRHLGLDDVLYCRGHAHLLN